MLVPVTPMYDVLDFGHFGKFENFIYPMFCFMEDECMSLRDVTDVFVAIAMLKKVLSSINGLYTYNTVENVTSCISHQLVIMSSGFNAVHVLLKILQICMIIAF